MALGVIGPFVDLDNMVLPLGGVLVGLVVLLVAVLWVVVLLVVLLVLVEWGLVV